MFRRRNQWPTKVEAEAEAVSHARLSLSPEITLHVSIILSQAPPFGRF